MNNKLFSKRPNEVGNYIEAYVKDAMQQYDLNPDVPAGITGKKKATGYPDIIFFFKDKPYYLECKTYNLENISTTQRSFYFSPSDDFKVIHDTHHFILSYEMFLDGRTGDKNKRQSALPDANSDTSSNIYSDVSTHSNVNFLKVLIYYHVMVN